MGAQRRVLILGATGRTGGRALVQLLDRGVPVVAIVRSAGRLPTGVVGNPSLTVVETDLLSVPVATLAEHLRGCEAVISCLGHTLSLRGVFGPPRDLVEHAVRSVRAAAVAVEPPTPIRLALMSSVSVNRPDKADQHRGSGQRALLGILRGLVPPARDNQRAADFLAHQVGGGDRHLEWVVVRPDSLVEGEMGPYEVHDEIVASLFRPDHTRMAQVAHFLCELVTDEGLWTRWRGQMPVITDATSAGDHGDR